MNYEKDLEINESILDVECLEQASLAMKYGKHYAECKEAFTKAEEKVKVVRAELVKEVSEDPDKYLGAGIKATGPNAEAYYRTHKRHKEAKQEWITAQYELDMADTAKWQISNTRKTMLEALIKLHGQQYFAGPSVPHDLTEQREMHSKQVQQGIGEGFKRSKKKKNKKQS